MICRCQMIECVNNCKAERTAEVKEVQPNKEQACKA